MYIINNLRLIKVASLLTIVLLGASQSTIALGQGLSQGVIGPIPHPRPQTGNAERDKYINRHIEPGNSYYSVRVVGASINVPERNVFARAFARAKQVTMTSSTLVQGVADVIPTRGINWVQDVVPGRQYELGVRPFLVDYMPAAGTSLAVTVEYRILQEGPATQTLSKMSNFINSNQQPLAGALRMGATESAGLGTVAAVSGIASQLIGSIFPAESERTTLKFNGEWPLRDGLKSSYYYILGAYNKEQLPTYEVASELRVQPVGAPDSGQAVLLTKDGEEYTENSYVIFEVSYYPELGKVFTPEWLDIYSSAVDRAKHFKSINPNPTQQQKDEAYAVCEGLVNQAKAFADRDKRYLHSEKEKHHRASITTCRSVILNVGGTSSGG